MTSMDDPIRFAKDAKQDAQFERSAGNFAEAEVILGEAIDALEERRTQLQEDELGGERARKLAAALCDCYGSLGGVRRSARRFPESVEAYDKGYQLERDPVNAIVDSYNLTQRLVARILTEPTAMLKCDPTEVSGELIPTALNQASQTVEGQIAGPRKRDPWAFADLALLDTLLSDTSNPFETRGPWAKLKDLGPPGYVFSSTSAVVQDCLQRLREVDATPAEEDKRAALVERLEATKAWLERAASDS